MSLAIRGDIHRLGGLGRGTCVIQRTAPTSAARESHLFQASPLAGAAAGGGHTKKALFYAARDTATCHKEAWLCKVPDYP